MKTIDQWSRERRQFRWLKTKPFRSYLKRIFRGKSGSAKFIRIELFRHFVDPPCNEIRFRTIPVKNSPECIVRHQIRIFIQGSYPVRYEYEKGGKIHCRLKWTEKLPPGTRSARGGNPLTSPIYCSVWAIRDTSSTIPSGLTTESTAVSYAIFISRSCQCGNRVKFWLSCNAIAKTPAR